MRIHCGAGSVYLKGWLNIDLPAPNIFLAKDRPDLVDKLATDESDYYGRHRSITMESLAEGPLNQECVVDEYGSFDHIPAAYWSCEEFLARHVFEHLSIGEAHKALDAIDEIMEPNGILRIDVPDHNETVRLLRETGDRFYERHLLGPRRNEFGYHLCGYSRERLRKLVEDHGFIYEREEENIHLYPSICLRFRKPGPRAPRDYIKLPDIPDDWRVLDVGPGQYPLMRANAYLDTTVEKLQSLQERGKETIIGDLMSGCPEIPDKSFDYVWVSHVLEHLPSPERAANTLTRIAKRGVLVMPSAWKEALTNFEESDHLWSVLENPNPQAAPVFVRARSERLDQLRNADVMKSLCRALRTGPNNRVTEESRTLRKWWYDKEAALDVVYCWESTCNVQVIG